MGAYQSDARANGLRPSEHSTRAPASGPAVSDCTRGGSFQGCQLKSTSTNDHFPNTLILVRVTHDDKLSLSIKGERERSFLV